MDHCFRSCSAASLAIVVPSLDLIFCQIQHLIIGQIEVGIIQQAVLTVLVTCLAGGIYNYRDVWKKMWRYHICTNIFYKKNKNKRPLEIKLCHFVFFLLAHGGHFQLQRQQKIGQRPIYQSKHVYFTCYW